MGKYKFIAHESEIYTNSRLKLYPTVTVAQVCNRSIFSPKGWELADGSPKRPYEVPTKGNAADAIRSIIESRRRAKAAVRDIALCNRFTYMFTWTLDKELVDRYDAAALYKKLRVFLSNATQRKDFEYVCIPEHHKDGAIHLHGLCNLGSVVIAPALRKDGTQITTNSRPVFNMVDWKLGFSTCVPLDSEYERACNYVAKYINKADSKIFGKWYLSSRRLKKRPDVVCLDRVDYAAFKADNPDLKEISLYKDVRLISKSIEESEVK